MQSVPRPAVVTEAIGTALLLWTIVASGIAVTRLPSTRDGSPLLQLSVHAAAIGLVLFAIIVLLGPISGAHLNPVVTLSAVLIGHLPRSWAAWYLAAQTAGAVLGVTAANLTFGLPAVDVAGRVRVGWVLLASEVGATFGLVLLIFLIVRAGGSLRIIGAAVGTYIAAAIVLTPSTAFANPAVTLARTLTDTFSGIAPGSVTGFVAAQVVGAVSAVVVVRRAVQRNRPLVSGA